jgi:cytoskeletal protein CcmA (bactofilin family)
MPEPDIRRVTPFPSGAADEPPLTILSEADVVEGRLEMKGEGHVMGGFRGEIECGGELLVGPDAHVSANIRALNLTISGLVAGNVLVRGRLKITATGQLRGDADVASLIVQEGGVHYGILRVHPEGIPEAPAPARQVAEHHGVRAPSPDAGTSPSGALNGPLNRPVERAKKLWGELF